MVLIGSSNAPIRSHSRILIKWVQNTSGTCLIVGNDGNCNGLKY